MRCPSSLGNGLNSSPGSSRWSFAHFTIRAIGTSCRSVITGTAPMARRAAAGERAGGRRHDTVRAVPVPVDLQLLRLVNDHASPALDHLMAAASNRGLLLALAGAFAVYLGLRSPHRWLAAVLLLVAVGVADVVSVRVVKPAVDRARPCQSLPSVRAPLGCGTGKSFP